MVSYRPFMNNFSVDLFFKKKCISRTILIHFMKNFNYSANRWNDSIRQWVRGCTVVRLQHSFYFCYFFTWRIGYFVINRIDVLGRWNILKCSWKANWIYFQKYISCQKWFEIFIYKSYTNNVQFPFKSMPYQIVRD